MKRGKNTYVRILGYSRLKALKAISRLPPILRILDSRDEVTSSFGKVLNNYFTVYTRSSFAICFLMNTLHYNSRLSTIQLHGCLTVALTGAYHVMIMMASTDDSCTSNHEALALLVSMGFDQELSAAALAVSGGNVESAINYLTDETAEAVLRAEVVSRLSSSAAGGGSMDSNRRMRKPMIVANSSQYSYDGGQSACTCMALEIAQGLVMSDEPASALSSTFLDRSLRRGLEIYTTILTSPTEHMSAEDSWTQFSNLKLQGEIVQGVLSHDPMHPQGLRSLLSGRCSSATQDEHHGNDWVFVVLTKTPETVLLCLSRRDGYWLVDSHPRPNIWPDAVNAYAKHHASLEEMVASVNLIFPIVDLGPDVPELMAVMYNSFDLYTFVKKPT